MSLCDNPFMQGNLPCPCGKCLPCITQRKNKWKHRILFENYNHDFSSFVTLTYEDDHLSFQNPETGEFTLPTLRPDDLQLFLKRIRKACSPNKLRFYACGEYGDTNWRPHYHLALFGYPPCYRGKTDKRKHSQNLPCCPPCDLLKEKWGKGVIENDPINDKTAAYIAGYINKKLTKDTDPRLEGRYKEFQRMSNRPGIGANIVNHLADALFTQHGKSMLTSTGDVPSSLNIGGRTVFLDRYIRNKLRDAVGVNEETKQKTLQKFTEEMRSMYIDALFNSEKPPLSMKAFLQQLNKQKVTNMKHKQAIHKKRRNL